MCRQRCRPTRHFGRTLRGWDQLGAFVSLIESWAPEWRKRSQARRILAGLLPNVYSSVEFRDEAAAFDRLAVAVTGETLTDVYLQHRRALEMEERGGARARVDAVEPRADGGFNAEASWTVGGTVTHFGHRHFRQNRYDTHVVVVPTDGVWKIQLIEVLEQERIR